MTTDSWSRRRPAVAAALVIITLTIVPAACKRQKRVMVQTVEESQALASVVATADPHVATQLLSGFYGVEQNAWRWTTGRFSVVAGSSRKEAVKGAGQQLKYA